MLTCFNDSHHIGTTTGVIRYTEILLYISVRLKIAAVLLVLICAENKLFMDFLDNFIKICSYGLFLIITPFFEIINVILSKNKGIL